MKNIIQLNIGLNDSDNNPINVHTACITAGNYGLDILASHVFDSPAGNEKTLVISAKYNSDEVDFQNDIFCLALALRQDCIAVYHGGKGELIGPKAETWGDFNPAFFVGLSGLTLADNAPIAPDCKHSKVGTSVKAFQFIGWLEHTLIPDLRESGSDATADDFETLIGHYRTLAKAVNQI